jgi:transposase-like protein
MLTELSVVEQRYLAVREALDGARITDVATRYGVDPTALSAVRPRMRDSGSEDTGNPSCIPN